MQSSISNNKCAPTESGAFCIACEGGMGGLGGYYTAYFLFLTAIFLFIKHIRKMAASYYNIDLVLKEKTVADLQYSFITAQV